MLRIKAASLNAAFLVSLLMFTGAAERNAAAAGTGTSSKAVCGDRNKPASCTLFSLTPDTEILATPVAENIFSRKPAVKTQKVIEPGRDLAPEVEDPVRIKAILKLVDDIYNDVPLPYPQDGATFKNKEGKLPRQPPGFYKEYTLLTGDAPHTVVIDGQTYEVAPDLSARGSERVIIGGGEFLYYTPDHYVNFIRLTVLQ
jgi:guanyl-specific ribonuclease Sa